MLGSRISRLTGIPLLFFFGVVVIGFIGYIMNVAKLIGMLGDPTMTPMFIARGVGAVLPFIGAVLGYF